ncbi:hypothetical protein V1477_001268 [Vespula maculifrons]|uniref:Uncharacterized protein n=4 Tax=Vespula TaxID=7451 RepID=A0A834J4V4_VESGE|nr:hypothetical protein HZH66_014873 [Vespula vulgaris]KAF7380637.1 hypothetical protein HZH68_016502 [Vespula germanica]KAF7390551.1 hypothetical protein H0235_017713 [Vespula pensylvanica]
MREGRGPSRARLMSKKCFPGAGAAPAAAGKAFSVSPSLRGLPGLPVGVHEGVTERRANGTVGGGRLQRRSNKLRF